jgi:hypothetical protein
MKRLIPLMLIICIVAIVCFAQAGSKLFSFEQLFPRAQQRQMGLHKLTTKEKDSLRNHIEGLLIQIAASPEPKTNTSNKPKTTTRANPSGGRIYIGVGEGHWIQKNIDSGTFMTLEDGSFWKIDPFDKIDAMLWLPITDITVTESSSGSPGYDYLLINTDDGEKAHAKYMGQK